MAEGDKSRKLSENELKRRKFKAKRRAADLFQNPEPWIKNIDDITRWDDQVGSTTTARDLHTTLQTILDSDRVKIDELDRATDLLTLIHLMREWEHDRKLPRSVKRHKKKEYEWWTYICDELQDIADGKFADYDTSSSQAESQSESEGSSGESDSDENARAAESVRDEIEENLLEKPPPPGDCSSDSDSDVFVMSSRTGEYSPLKKTNRKKSDTTPTASPQRNPKKTKFDMSLQPTMSPTDDATTRQSVLPSLPATEHADTRSCSPSTAPPPLTKQQKYERYKTENAKFAAKVNEQRAQIAKLQSENTKLDTQRNSLQTRLNLSTAYVTSLKDQLTEKDKQIDTLEGSHHTLFTKTIADGSDAFLAVRDVMDVIIKSLNNGCTLELELFTDDSGSGGDAKAANYKEHDGSRDEPRNDPDAPEDGNGDCEEDGDSPGPILCPEDGTQDD
ncbi:hypothetical protein INS49_009716 [Diaporthe citri]|uniref:uncharacterized protein n=1 Tax=Diaporthe citri TaxID=83186 RepID=UPI001C7E9E91|nr:uncharacterized protein INS49_009716 [Diaporthe citri]KAG6361489.1 hypothetical protein INS49_009716 [Diaporthe citri]